MNVINLEKQENVLNDFASTQRILLRSSYTEFMTSIFTVRLGEYYGLNKDYELEGLTVQDENNNTEKIIENIFYSFNKEAKEIKNRITPWKFEIDYELENQIITASYGLDHLEQTIYLTFTSEKSFPLKLKIFYPEKSFRNEDNTIQIEKYKVRTTSNENKFTFLNEEIKWEYKLGWGFRNQNKKFIHSNRKIKSFGYFEFPEKKKHSIKISTLLLPRNASAFSELFQKQNYLKVVNNEKEMLKFYEEKFGSELSTALAFRIYNCIYKFDLNELLDAGSLWFRKPWARDGIHMLNQELEYFIKYRPRFTKKLVYNIIKNLKQEKLPLLLNTSIQGGIDQTLELALLLKKYSVYDDKTFLTGLHVASNLAKEYRENGLIYCNPSFSWTDCIINKEKSIRTLEPLNEKASLVEINAMAYKIEQDYGVEVVDQDKFKEQFKGFTHAITKNNTYSELNSLTLEKYEYTPELFKDEQAETLEKIKTIFIKRKDKLFGIKTIDRDSYYIDDNQYHTCTYWPREGRFLYNFLEKNNQTRLCEELLKTNLEATLEGCVGFQSELYSPQEEQQTPVPVKNPAQFWSLFIKPYKNYFESQKNKVNSI